jgi:hypothetical protein
MVPNAFDSIDDMALLRRFKVLTFLNPMKALLAILLILLFSRLKLCKLFNSFMTVTTLNDSSKSK